MRLSLRFAALILVAGILPACDGGMAVATFVGTTVNGTLSGSQVVPALGTGATGTAALNVDQVGRFIDYTIDVTGLSGAATAVEIHLGKPGEDGPLLFTFPPGAFPLSGKLQPPTGFTPAGGITSFENAALVVASGGTHLLIKTAAQPDGEVRAHLGTATLASAVLSGAQRVAPLAGTGKGSMTVTLNTLQDELKVTLTVSGLTSAVTVAQIFDAPPGTAGTTALFDLATTTFSGSISVTLDSTDFTPSAGVPTFADVIPALLSGRLFVQVATLTNPAGEVRGQIGPTQLNAVLTSADVVPPNTSTATGSATLSLNGTQTAFLLRMTHTVAAADRSSMYTEAAGSNGPKIFDLDAAAGAATSPFTATLTPVRLIPNAPQNILTFPDAVNAILTQKTYVDVGNASFPAGEIRGQLLP